MSLFILPLVGFENHSLALWRARGGGRGIIFIYFCCLAGKYVQEGTRIAAPWLSVVECVQEEKNVQNSDPRVLHIKEAPITLCSVNMCALTCLLNLQFSLFSSILVGFYHLAVIHNFHCKYLLHME